MEQCAVIFDVHDEANMINVRTVKLWNDPEKAAQDVMNYINLRTNLTWRKNDNKEFLEKVSPKSFIELYGYKKYISDADPNESEVADIITMYRIEVEDPDDDISKEEKVSNE